MRYFIALLFWFVYQPGISQEITNKLSKAITKLEADTQFRHSMISVYVVENEFGKVVFERNSELGLAPASCQKLVTSVAAFELLGKNYKYQTDFAYTGLVKNEFLDGNGII